MELLLPLILSFVFGTVIGSFLNVVSLRFNTGMGIGGRSKCLSCGTTLTWKELVPILSFAGQKGACKNCKTRISWQYPLIEFAAGVIFALVFFMFPPVTPLAAATTVFYLVISCLLLVISAYDVKHKIIPDRFVYTFDAIALVSLFVGGSSWFHVPGWSALIAGPILALPLALIWVVSKGRWMGLGDAKLTLGLGWMLGIAGGINSIILSFWIAAAVSLIWLFATYKSFRPKTEIPFGPFLILGMYIVLFTGLKVLDVHLIKDLIMGI